jgi:peptide-methionine (S)-S-oxide reductase
VLTFTPHEFLTLCLRTGVVLLGFWIIVKVWRRALMAAPARTAPIPAPTHDIVMPESGYEAGETHTAVFAGGCFWGVQSVFQRVKGVLDTVVGYAGGEAGTANYRTVCEDWTGHAEAIEITFDPSIVTYGTLLRILFSVVSDPTQLNRQGNDVGTSYRSAIFTTDDEQAEVARAYVKQLDAAHIWTKPIVTEITPLIAFFRGEDYHQDYAMKNPQNPYIQVCDVPKIAALERQFPELLQPYRMR